MGLSKKLGAASNQRVAEVPNSNLFAYQWSSQSYTIQEISNKFKLPCIVQCVTDSCTVVWSDFEFDLRQPLLLYSSRCVKKVHGRSLQATPSGDVEEFGPPLAIPEDYDGWFGASSKSVSKTQRHLRVKGVADAGARRFLVTTKCPAYTSAPTASVSSGVQYIDRDIQPGEVLTRVCVMESDQNLPETATIMRHHGACLECIDDRGEDVVVPMKNMALIYEVSENYPSEIHRAFQISSVIQAGNTKLPRIVNLVHGDPPNLSYSFTGLLRCYSVFTEETILAATLDDKRSLCLELGTDSCTKFNICLNQSAIKKTIEYSNAFSVCQTNGSKFLTGIKVSFALKPDVSHLDDIDFSYYENASCSDMQEIEANSEFVIAWQPEEQENVIFNDFPRESNDNDTEDSINENSIDFDINIQESSEDRHFHKDLTSKQLENLVQRENQSDDLNKIEKDNKVTDNPLFYYFQRNPNDNPWIQNDEKDKNESLDSELFYDDSEIEMAESEFKRVVCTSAKEYESGTSDDGSSSDEFETISQTKKPQNDFMKTDTGQDQAVFKQLTDNDESFQEFDLLNADANSSNNDIISLSPVDESMKVFEQYIRKDNVDTNMERINRNTKQKYSDSNLGEQFYNKIIQESYMTSQSSDIVPNGENEARSVENFQLKKDGVNILEKTGINFDNYQCSEKTNVTVGLSKELKQFPQTCDNSISRHSNQIKEPACVNQRSTIQHSINNLCTSLESKGHKKERKRHSISTPCNENKANSDSRISRYTSSSDLSSLFPGKESENRFQSSKITLFPHEHPHRRKNDSVKQSKNRSSIGLQDEHFVDNGPQSENGKENQSDKTIELSCSSSLSSIANIKDHQSYKADISTVGSTVKTHIPCNKGSIDKKNNPNPTEKTDTDLSIQSNNVSLIKSEKQTINNPEKEDEFVSIEETFHFV